jgi:tetratricopeptide (TPR) repeat protein
MRHERAFLEQVVESLADGNDIDWSALEGRVDSAEDRRVLEQLKILARIAEVHRSHASEPEEDPSLALLRSRGFGAKVIPMPVAAPADALPPGAVAPAGNGAAVNGVPVPGAAVPLPLNATQVAPAPPPVQTRWGHLELQERIGEGTFGEVYRARDTQLDREVAVKLLRVGGLSTDRQTRRVLREGRSLARVEHDNVVAVYGAEAHEGRVGLWMELIRGATLEQLLRAHGPFSAREAALIGQDLCSAVAAVHNTGLVHRDIKAQNVMREEGGRLVLMDFGAGQPAGDASAFGRITGTPMYLAPEVLAGGESTAKSDIYSIGVLLYHLVTNDYPVRANSLQELREAHAQGRRTHLHDARPELPGGLIQVIERAIEPDAQRRYQTAGEMQAALDRFLASPDDRESDDLSWIPMPKPLVARLRRMGRTRALALAVAAGAACLALGAGIAWQTFRHTSTLGVTGQPNVIAVIDLARGNGVADYEAAGVTEGIHDLLSTSEALHVVSRRSVQAVSRQQLSTPELAQRLGANTLIEGRLERAAENYQLSLRLIRAGSDQSVSLGTFTAPISQRLGLWQPAAEAVARALRTPLPSMPRPRLHATGVLASDAQEKYARARYYLNTAGNFAHRNLSARLFEEAIAIAPDFAEAHSGLARTYYAIASHPRENQRDRLAEAREHAEHALRLDSSLAEAHTVLGVVAFYDWRWEDAEREFTKAVMLSPSNEFAVERYAMFLASRGRVQEGITYLTKVRRLDPLSPFVAYSTAMLLTYDERYDEALAELQRARKLDPSDTATHLVSGRLLSAAGRYDDAIDSFRQALGGSAGIRYALAEIGAAEAGAGRRNEAIRIAKQLEDDTARDPEERQQPELIGYLYAKLGDNDRAFAWLERAFDERIARVLWLKVDPRAKPLRNDPRFAALLARLDLQP